MMTRDTMAKKNRRDKNMTNDPSQNVNEDVKSRQARESFKDSAATEASERARQENPSPRQETDVNKKIDEDKAKGLAEKEFGNYSEVGQIQKLDNPALEQRTETQYVNSIGEINENMPHSHLQRLRKALKILQEEIGHLDRSATTVI